MISQLRSRRVGFAILATALGACGTDSGIERPTTASGTSPIMSTDLPLGCERLTGPEPVNIRVQWAGPWDPDTAPALIVRFEATAPGVRVDVAEPVESGAPVSMLLGADPPTLTRVPADAVRELARAGAIRPIDDCVNDRLDADGELDAARELGLVDETRYGIAGNIDVSMMLYDASAFERAGLDPASPPSTWRELRDAAIVLHDRASIAQPVAGLSPTAAVADETITDEIPRGGREWLAIQAAGLLLDPSAATDEELPPLGAGSAGIEFVHVDGLWGYAAALADGQAPDADLRVAASPGSADGRVVVGGDVWVISARSTPDQATMASALLEWLVSAPQQAKLHTLTDLFPTTSSAAADPVAVGYWNRLPLLADVWPRLSQVAVAPADWTDAPGAVLAAKNALASDGDESTAEQRWAQLSAALDASRTIEANELLVCAYPVHDRPTPLTSCISGPDS